MRAGEMRSLAQLYRGTETAGPLRSTQTTWAPSGNAWGGFLPQYLTLRSYGAGEAPAGARELVVHPGVDVRARDGVAIVAGPENGTRWRVIDVDESDPREWRVRLESYGESFL